MGLEAEMGDRAYTTGLKVSSRKRCLWTTVAMLSQVSSTAFHCGNKIIQKAPFVENVRKEINPPSYYPLALLLESEPKFKCHSLVHSESPKLCRLQFSHLWNGNNNAYNAFRRTEYNVYETPRYLEHTNARDPHCFSAIGCMCGEAVRDRSSECWQELILKHEGVWEGTFWGLGHFKMNHCVWEGIKSEKDNKSCQNFYFLT